MEKRKFNLLIMDVVGVTVAAIGFLVPFYFIIVNALKTPVDAAKMNAVLPKQWIWKNFSDVLNYQNGIVLIAFKNSLLLTLFSIVGIVITCPMAAFVIQRNSHRKKRVTAVINFVILLGLMLSPAIVPTFWILNLLHIFKTIGSMVMIEIAISSSFSIMLYIGFVESIPTEIDEAAIIDGCGTLKLFFNIIFPVLKPITATVIILNIVSIFNDFVNPLYFLPGKYNVTVQLTLYYFNSRYSSSWNLLFADVLLITIPPLILYIFFNKQIVAGMVNGAVKG